MGANIALITAFRTTSARVVREERSTVLLNLLDNALRHTHAGGEIRISGERG